MAAWCDISSCEVGGINFNNLLVLSNLLKLRLSDYLKTEVILIKGLSFF